MEEHFDTAIANVKRFLQDFKAAESYASDFALEQYRDSIDRELFPVPSLIRFVLHGVCGFPLGYPGEKTHWIIPFTYRDASCAISHEKFGLRLYVRNNINKNELLSKLKKAIAVTEKFILADIAKDQIKSGNITIDNQFSRLDGQYAFFREKAEAAYATQKREDEDGSIEGISESLNRMFRASAEAAYNALAMIDAYFSRLEHFLVLALPFSEYDRSLDELTDFVGKIWSEKMKRILNIEIHPAQLYYAHLVAVKEKYRNTFAHGGFEKKGASFYFHLPRFGVIPASMSGHKDSVHFDLFPINEDAFRNVCALFDEFDTWLKNTGKPLAWKYAERGLALSFGEKDISEMLSAASDPASYDKWLDHQSYIVDMYANADY